MHNTALLGITLTLVILGSSSLAFATTDGSIESFTKITNQTVGTADGNTIGFDAGDMFGYKITNMGDLDGNGAEDFATIAFGTSGIGTTYSYVNDTYSDILPNGILQGNSYLTLLNTDGTVNASHELSNCAEVNERRESSTFGESIDYLGKINGNPTLLISDYWFSTIHVLTINPNDYSHTCSEISSNTLEGMGWPFAVAGTLEVDNVVDTVPDLIVGADNVDETGTDLYVLDLDVDNAFNIINTNSSVNDSRVTSLDKNWNTRYFENMVVAEIDGNPNTIDLVIGEPRAFFDNGDPNTEFNGSLHVAFILKSSRIMTSVTTIDFVEFSKAGIDINRNTGSHFGIGLANMGDLDGDGIDDMAVGLEGASIGYSNSGAVTIMFLNNDGTLKNLSIITNGEAPFPLQKSDLFGKGVAAIDIDGDTFPELVASAHQDNTGGENAGAVYVLTFNQDLGGLSYDMIPTPIVLNPTFDNYFNLIQQDFTNYAYADESTPMFGVTSLTFTSTVTQNGVLTNQVVNFDVSNESDETTYCNGLTIDELISNENYTVFDNRDGSLGSEVKGTSGNDLMIASNNGDTLIGKYGDDCMIGGAGNDILKGKKGNDIIYGNDGDDLIRGMWGDDTIFGGEGNDELHGGKGSDTITGGLGDDILRGKKGTDTLYGGLGNDNLFGGKDNDFLYGNEGDDSLNGRKGTDTCDGGSGINTIKNCEL